MDEQLKWITELLDSAAIKYWTDSGTLLGLVRDGKLLDNDGDIDIGILDDDRSKLLGLIDEFGNRGFTTRRSTYAGHVFKLKLLSDKPSIRKVDVNIFSRSNGYLWCPQAIAHQNLGKASLLYELRENRWNPSKCITLILTRALRRVALRYLSVVAMDRYPWVWVWLLYTWWIPEAIIQPAVYSDHLSVWVPSRTEEYLQLRYGNWRVPVRDWAFARDDRGLRHVDPRKLGVGAPVVHEE